MNGSAGSNRQKGRKQELAGLNGAVPASMPGSEGPVVGLAARIVEIISSGIHCSSSDVRSGSKADIRPANGDVRQVPQAEVTAAGGPNAFPYLWLANEKSPGSLRGGLSFQKSTICPGSAADWCAQARIELR